MIGLDLSASPLLTSLTKGADDSMSWLGGLAADFLGFNPEKPPKKEEGNCAGLGFDFLQMIPCEKPSKFMCEARTPQKYRKSVLKRCTSLTLN
jgi:hypothetical protein